MGRHKHQVRTGPAESLADQRERFVRCTQEEMARRLGCSQTFISQVENSLKPAPQLKRWAREYRCSKRRFQALADNQFLLPLWRFAKREPSPAVQLNGGERTIAV